MSAINNVTATQPSIYTTTGKSSAPQTVASSQPQPTTNDSSATISQAAKDLAAQENKVTPYSDDPRAAAAFMQNMAEKFAGLNQGRAQYASDPSNPLYAT